MYRVYELSMPDSGIRMPKIWKHGTQDMEMYKFPGKIYHEELAMRGLPLWSHLSHNGPSELCEAGRMPMFLR